MNWEPAEKVQKNDQGQFRAMIGGEWVPVEKAQKNESGQYRIIRTTEQEKPSLPQEDVSLADKIKGSAKEVAVDLPRAALYWGLHKPAMAGTQLLFNALASGSEAVAPDTKVSKYLRGEATRSGEMAQRIEKNYQALVPDNPASYTGAAFGSVMPFSKAGYLKGPMETVGKIGKPVEDVTKAILKSPKLAKYAGKVASGAGMGATVSLATPVTEEGDYWDNLIRKAEFGTGVGAAIPGVGIPLLKAGKWAAEKGKEIITPWSEKLRTSAGRKYLDEALGDARQKIVNAINEYNQPSQIGPQPQVKLGPVTTADIIAGANVGKTDKFGSQLVKAEQQLSSQGGGISDAAKSIHAAQEAARAAEIGKIAQTPEALAAAEAARASATTPMREAAIRNANIAGVKVPELQSRVTDRTLQAEQAVEDVRRLSKAAAHAEELGNMGRATLSEGSTPMAIGMPRLSPKDSYGYELAKLGESRAAGSADLSLQRGAESRFAQKQLESLAQAGHFPLESDKIVGQISRIQKTPGNVANTTIQKAMDEIKGLIAKATDKNGVIDARELYTIRKSEAGNVIAKFAEENKTWDKRFTAGLLKDVQKMIDDAIESSGGTGWKDYLTKYSELSGPIDRMRVGREIEKALVGATGKERATTFANAQQEAARTIKRATGSQRYNDLGEVLTAPEMASTDKVTRALLRETEKRNLASGTEVRDLFNIVEGAKGSFQFPHLLSRPMVFGNWLFKITGNSADDLIAKDIGNLLIKDPQKFALKYLTDVPPSKVSTAIQELQKMKMQSLVAPSTQYAIQENK